MTPQKPQEPTILESSETESFSSDKAPTISIGDDLSLDDLFHNLKQETKPTNISIDEQSDYEKIQKSISKLPQITSNLEQTLAAAKPSSKKTSIRIYDPVSVQSKTTNDKETTDARWFHMKQPEMTPQIKRDLLIIQQRNALDPKRHYKKEKWQIPKFFQMGTIVEGNTEFYSARMNRKQRGTSLVQEILNDDETKKYFKRKYGEIQVSKTSGRKAHYKKVQNARRKF